ncbi:hypothetical protein GCM10009830_37290 [Glycomyces endophyticus]|uniref:Uncharacterized protein n=1 Tax=Glycomyces endophyticus TaxID=480996 RepID=A0ABN2HDU4_9ACTN
MESFERPFGDESGPVQAPMHPAWIRIMPCSIELFRTVPSLNPFPAGWWADAFPEDDIWNEPVWCDPGDVDDWIAEASEHHLGASAEVVEKEAREEYDRATAERSERIDTFTTHCRRAGLPVPHTVRDLLEFLLALGLYRSEHRDGVLHVAPQLYINPFDVLSFDKLEAIEEAADQRGDLEELTAIAIRRVGGVDYEFDDEGRFTLPGNAKSATVQVTLAALAEDAGVPAPVVRGMLMELAEDGDVAGSVDLGAVPVADEFTLTASDDLLGGYPNDELLPPEHA